MPNYTEQDFANNVNYLAETKNLIKEAIINKGQSVNNNTPFRLYANLISNISGGSQVGNLYVFNNTAEMNNCTNINVGDFGVIYDNINNTLGSVYEATYNTQSNVVAFSISKTNFTADSSKVWQGEFYGANGVESGELNSNIIYNDLTKYKLRDRLNTFYSMDTRVNTDGMDSALGLFNGCTNIVLIPAINTANAYTFVAMFGVHSVFKNTVAAERLITVPLFNTANLKGSGQMFNNCINLVTIPNINFGNSDSILMFNNCQNLKTIPNINVKSNITTMVQMFCNCYNLEVVPNLDFSHITNMCDAFQNCRSLEYVPNFNLSSTTNMLRTFENCRALKEVPNFDVSNVTFMYNTFGYCTNLTTVPNFKLDNCQNCGSMFFGCSNLTTVPNFNLGGSTCIHYMFSGCRNLTTVPNFNTCAVTDMSGLFAWCENLTAIPNLNTDNVTSIRSMYINCIKFTEFPVINTAKVTDMGNIFQGCTGLVTAPNYNTVLVTEMGSMFTGCVNLVNVPQYNTSNVVNVVDMFRECDSLSDASIQNIINMMLNSNVTNTQLKNLSNADRYSIFNNTNITSARYSNRLSELSAKGWSY